VIKHSPHILVVKLSSLGDVVHTMPAVQDIVRSVPNARIDWVVEEGFADLAEMTAGVQNVIRISLRRWRRQGLLGRQSREEFAAFRELLAQQPYDHVIDFQGLVKSAIVTKLARTTLTGTRAGLANRTEGSSYEPLARLAYTQAYAITPRVHAIERSRQLAARALRYAKPVDLKFGFTAPQMELELAHSLPLQYVVFVHGTSRADKCWLEHHWVVLGKMLAEYGLSVVLPWGNAEEAVAARDIARGIGDAAVVLPKMSLRQVASVLQASTAVVGVDSGLVHMASALDKPTVQLYNFDTAWRTGGYWSPHIINVGGPAMPTLDEVAQALANVLPVVAR
jgi:heptosyltransferase-1